MTSFLRGLTGSFSQSAAQNPTVNIMEAAYDFHELGIRYINCEVAPEQLKDAVAGAVAMGWLGFNCSIPHKETVVDLLDELAPSARLIGAVNTVVIKDGHLIGENTDGKGFVTAVSPLCDPRDTHAVILGAGGAARAIAVELALAGARELSIVNRSRERGEALAELITTSTAATATFHHWTEEFSIPHDASIVVNATSLGFYPHHLETPAVDVHSFPPGAVVADVVPNPPQTQFLSAAADAGCRTLPGIGMLVSQARVNGELWTGTVMDEDVMLRALREALGIDTAP